MGRASIIQTNFSGGELSPALALGRVDIAKYNNGARRIENCTLTIQGGAKRRPGSRYLGPVKDETQRTRLIDFIYNRDQAYVLELGAGYVRFLRNRASLGVEVASPYTTPQVWGMNFVQKSDTAFFVHESVTPQRLQRFGDLLWVMAPPPFNPPPVEEQGFYPGATLTLGSAALGATTATASASTFLASDAGRSIVVGGGRALITAVTTDVLASVVVQQPFASTTAAGGAWNIDGSPQASITPSATGNPGDDISLDGVAVWRAEDVGKVVSVNGGSMLIFFVLSADNASARVLTPATAVTPAAPGSWVLQAPAWNARTGYPRAVSIDKQRLLFAGSPGYPQTIWGSEIQGYLNFAFGTNDDQAYRFELDGPRNSPIRHVVPARKLLVLTESDEMTLDGSQDKPITPTNIQKTDQSTVGSSGVRPVKVANEMLFVQAAGKKIVAAGYRYDIDGVASPDRTVFASHITGSGVVQLSHQKEPDSTLLAVRTDGQMAVCAYDIEQEVTGWSRWITQGAYESIATVPTATAEDTYAVVRRTVQGATRRFIEVFDADMLVDCGIAGTHPTGQATWGGLGHLEGLVVQAWADGAYLGEYTVQGAAITLTRPAQSVQIGLGFTCLVEMLQVEVAGNGTTAQGSSIQVNEVIVRVLDTTAALINGEEIEFRRFGDELLDLPPPNVSGDVRRTQLSDEIYKSKVIVSQPLPLPFHLLDVIRKVTINE